MEELLQHLKGSGKEGGSSRRSVVKAIHKIETEARQSAEHIAS